MNRTLSLGSYGSDVLTLQRALIANGAPLVADGHFGPKTFAALEAFQAVKGLTIDGVAGPQTFTALGILAAAPSLQAPAPQTDFFDAAFAYTIGNEGGYTNDPADAGGPTRWGIIQSEYSKYIGHPATIAEMRSLPIGDAKNIYRRQYWNALHLGLVEARNPAMALFDRSVLNGLLGVSRLVRTALGRAEDGVGNIDACIADINSTNPIAFVMRLADAAEAQHRARVAAHPDQHVFLAGWLNRVNRMRRELGDGTTKV